MSETRFHDRRAVQIQNDDVCVTVTVEGGHIAEIRHKASGVNPLWIPPWPSIEPSAYDPHANPEYGSDAESKLLAGIMGHSLCLDLFGAPSREEAAAGITVHGEASVVGYDIAVSSTAFTARCTMPIAQLAFKRNVRLAGRRVLFTETVENLSALDRPIAWTQHVTLGPPFLDPHSTQFRFPSVKSSELSDFFTTHLMNPEQERAWFWAWSPATQALIGYVWRRSDFPWLGIWREDHGRTHPPWNGQALTRGMEFGVSPFPESRRQMIDRRTLFDTPCYRWIPAGCKLTVGYYAAVGQAPAIPETLAEFEA